MVRSDNWNLPEGGQELTAKWGWFLVLGIILLVVGIIAAFTLPFATAAVAIYIGIMMLIGGVIQIIHAFGVRSWGRFFYWLLAGLLYTVGGVICLLEPILAAAVFTFLLGFLLVVAGVIRVVVGFQSRTVKGYGWIIAAGIVTAIAGLIITTGWPANTLWVLGLFLSIDLIFQGWSWIGFSFGLRALKNFGK
ncbi:HdeD family acid-resistance protein [uncultured Bartonella sp.]|uniref:HdeD family acid-resistance protein n=1 Tax=uncultured Bartonella sp. TaxID=104108 RepID=UPI002623B6AE|nr:HdeD family acid-resistance protein [uncultured Bartonella sp.]